MARRRSHSGGDPPLLDLRDERFADDAAAVSRNSDSRSLEDRIDDDLAAGRHAELVAELEELVEENPLRERLQGQLMRALYGAGRQGDALDVYRRARQDAQRRARPRARARNSRSSSERSSSRIRSWRRPRHHRGVRSRPAVRRANRRIGLLALLGALILAAALVGIVRATGGSGGPILATKNSLAVVDPHRNRVVEVIPIGATPRGVTVGTKFVWTANAGEGTVSQIDPKELRVVQTIGLGLAATDLVEARGEVWVATGSDNEHRPDRRAVRRCARRGRSSRTDVPQAHTRSLQAPTRSGLGRAATIFKIDASSHELVGRWHYGGGDQRCSPSAAAPYGSRAARRRWGGLGDDRPSDRERDIGVIPTALAIGDGSDLGCRSGAIRSSRGRLAARPRHGAGHPDD